MTKMEFPRLEDTVNKSRWHFSQSKTNTDEHNGWRKLCATDCNGSIQNIGNPSKTCGCFIMNSNSHRHPDGKKTNKGEVKKPKEPPVNKGSGFDSVLLKKNENKLNTVFDRTNTFLSKQNIISKDKNLLVNSELSYFSDKNSHDLGLSKFLDNGSEECHLKKFTLFPEKSNSSPSILDGLNSYFRKNTSPRLRCLSDPQCKPPVPSNENRKEYSPDLGFNYRECSPTFVSSRVSSLKSKIDELELDFKIKDETINENGKLPSVFTDKHCHGLNEQTFYQQEKTPIVDESFVPLSGLMPKRLFDSYPFQDCQPVVNQAQAKYVHRRKEKDSFHHKPSKPNSVNTEKPWQKLIIPFKNASEFFPIQPHPYHSLNYPPMNMNPQAHFGVDQDRLSHDWLNFISKFQSFTPGSMECNFYRAEKVADSQAQGKKNYKKNNQPAMECKFCKSNMESPKMYKSHNLKQRIGKRTLVTCPVLRKLVCERCGETGDNAHTLSYCPRVIAESGKKPVSVAAELKKTRRVASGRMRKPF